MTNLRELSRWFDDNTASDVPTRQLVDQLQTAADKAEVFAFDLASLIDGQDDELGRLLTPIKEFLAGLAGIPLGKRA